MHACRHCLGYGQQSLPRVCADILCLPLISSWSLLMWFATLISKVTLYLHPSFTPSFGRQSPAAKVAPVWLRPVSQSSWMKFVIPAIAQMSFCWTWVLAHNSRLCGIFLQLLFPPVQRPGIVNSCFQALLVLHPAIVCLQICYLLVAGLLLAPWTGQLLILERLEEPVTLTGADPLNLGPPRGSSNFNIM